jgi:hypothetical protein
MHLNLITIVIAILYTCYSCTNILIINESSLAYCYNIVDIIVTQVEADLYCRNHNSYLPSLHSTLEKYYLYNIVQSRIWSGMKTYNSFVKFPYHWSDGTPYDYNNFTYIDTSFEKVCRFSINANEVIRYRFQLDNTNTIIRYIFLRSLSTNM